ncbi:hypothetical protein DN523_11565 [Burkholderia multivorans]|uniref:Uncharacterized protein n=2 Tax=Burkholderia multivorans TaxID=87883 RepID=A0A228DLE6_9BURK|nr:hypothetical protein A8H40_17520 [Burkholderia multivorans]EED98122.1 hypothetical protein BURMUCGD1_2716 [Burkholderia multivorans CGD1]EEE06279.1 hypothetical protein BURMUCGD2_2982 [Burkholderia multivorans CGD2]EEE11269.1 hypothetical protein BURMUCGD2M_3067 [Burkholderia multivorans CGD2M]EJO51571.1 hypothetical protein BURMUCF2_0508 [Burkholderia multivorans CF2]
MGSVKHTVSVKCVQVDRVAEYTALLAGPARRGGRIRVTRGRTATGDARDGAQRLPRRTAKTAPCASRWDAPP